MLDVKVEFMDNRPTKCVEIRPIHNLKRVLVRSVIEFSTKKLSKPIRERDE
jgi:hypothetical protein